MNWTKLAIKSVRDAFSAINSILDTKEAGQILGINPKGDKTYKIDKIAESAYLNNLPDNVTLISEESLPKPGSDVIVFLDPVCGSILAKRGSNYFATAISVYTKQLEPICEAIGLLSTGDIYHADKTGAYKNDKKIHTSNKKKIDETTVVSFEAHLPLERIKASKTKLFKIAPHAYCPSIVKVALCLLAEGRIDAHIDADKTEPPTELIGTYMVKQAGGVVSDIKGNPIKMHTNMKKNTTLFCSCTKEMHAALLKMV